MEPREVPLGRPAGDAGTPHAAAAARSLIGAWCFVDHYGPDDVAATGGMSVAPHPHTGLQTVSWLFTGEIEHRDSAGHHAHGAPRRAQPDDRGPRDQPLGGVHRRDHRAARRPAVGRAARRRPATASRASPTTRRRRAAARAGRPGSSWARCSATPRRSPPRTPAARGRAAARAPARRSSSTSTRRTSTACSSTPARHVTAGGTRRSQPHELAYVPPGRATLALGRRERRAAAAARRAAVRRGDRDVVELRGPQPRRDRGFRDQWQAQITATARSWRLQDVHDGRFGVVVGRPPAADPRAAAAERPPARAALSRPPAATGPGVACGWMAP